MSVFPNLYKDIVLKERAACPNTGTKAPGGICCFYKDIVLKERAACPNTGTKSPVASAVSYCSSSPGQPLIP